MKKVFYLLVLLVLSPAIVILLGTVQIIGIAISIIRGDE